MPRKISQEEFIDRSKYIHNNKYSYRYVQYINSKTHVIVSCNQHGNWSVLPNNHMNNKTGCPKCYGKVRRTLDEFIKQADEIHKIYDYSHVTYINDYSKVNIKCKLHGIFKVTPTNHIHRKSGCPICSKILVAKKLSMGLSEFIKRGNEIHENLYDYSLVEYINNHTKVKIICPKHGVFLQQPQLHLNQQCSCAKCNSSKGERNVRKWLNAHNFIFTEQKTFKDCRYKKMLSYDFYLPNENILIEFQGYQHYDKNSNFYKRGNDTFEIVQLRDNIKRKYAKNNGFQLIEIHYNQSINKSLTNNLLIM